MNIYYVYAYLRKDGTPYYIGKGKGKRAWDKAHNVSVPKDCSKIVFLETKLTNIGACALERRYIKWYGRKDISTGILYNRTDGGEGASGAKLSLSHRMQIKAFWAGKSKPWSSRPGTLNTFYGKTHSPETKEQLSLAKKGSNNPMHGRKQARVCCIYCKKETAVNTLSIHHTH